MKLSKHNQDRKGAASAKKTGTPKVTKECQESNKKTTDATPAPAPVTTTEIATTNFTPVAATTPKKLGKQAIKSKKVIVQLILTI